MSKANAGMYTRRPLWLTGLALVRNARTVYMPNPGRLGRLGTPPLSCNGAFCASGGRVIVTGVL
jgi:hypothetical protein